MATAPADPANITLDRSDGSATLDLYRAALGPVRTDFYLKAFTRFDAAGKPGPSWNWIAALLTVNWLLFHRLWIQLLAYVGAVAASLLLLFGIGRLLFQLGDASQWALLGLALLLAIGVPGALGNAWLYATCNKAMEAALAASANVEEACALLSKRAAQRKHLGALAAGNLAVAALVVTLALLWPQSSALPLQSSQMELARETPALGLQGGLLQSGLATKSVAAAQDSSVAPAAVASAAQVLPAAVPTRSSQGLVQAATETAPAAKASAPAPAVAAAAKASEPPSAQPTKAERKAQRKAPATQASAATDARFLVNVGLFADPNNARNAYAKLQEAGLPASSQALKSAKGRRTRVRAGPFETEAEANRAAEKIRALQLEAAVVQR